MYFSIWMLCINNLQQLTQTGVSPLTPTTARGILLWSQKSNNNLSWMLHRLYAFCYPEQKRVGKMSVLCIKRPFAPRNGLMVSKDLTLSRGKTLSILLMYMSCWVLKPKKPTQGKLHISLKSVQRHKEPHPILKGYVESNKTLQTCLVLPSVLMHQVQ